MKRLDTVVFVATVALNGSIFRSSGVPLTRLVMRKTQQSGNWIWENSID